MASPLIQFRAIDDMAKDIESRTQLYGGDEAERQKDRILSETVRRDLERFYKAIPSTLHAINLSLPEAMLIIDSLNGYLMTPELPQLMVHNVRDSIEMDGLDKKWNVDAQALMQKLGQLTPIECLAITDAVERWWINPTYHIDQEEETYEQRCIRVGLIRAPRRSTLAPESTGE